MLRRSFLAIVFASPLSFAKTAQGVLLAQDYKPGIDISQYLISEKLDGVRALWDGKSLRFRSGQSISAPAWFTAKLPSTPLDGELWLARGKFDELSGIVRKLQPVDTEWQSVKYMVFELPAGDGTFAQRNEKLQALVKQTNWPQLQWVEQFKLSDDKTLQAKLKQITAQSGEGLMLHKADAPVTTGRSAVLLKLKPVSDAEGVVTAHIPGKGKYQGMLGALQIKTEDGHSVKIGTGFSDEQRKNPPPVGSTITYSYRDTTPSGKPRFAAFLRVRHAGT
ncbi:DNA ligase [Variovorax sp. PCZ-1]|uniref:DNA ligase n=1 Tax=Variovorax sp. PCZ-1 TaxID=2835533 RepID=UPI001BCBA686|nr:DNA ligase [Variovorax sp. PCZ-1]MBS7807534.1 DNA ligase [Variovorax sp. PCZ-1]